MCDPFRDGELCKLRMSSSFAPALSLRLSARYATKMRTSISLFAFATTVLGQAAKGPIPAKGDAGSMGGVFGPDMKNIGSMGGMLKGGGSLLASGSESPAKGNSGSPQDPGSGPYPAHMVSDPTLPQHTIYAPKSPPPADVKMPVVVWGNGGCMATGNSFAVFLTEIASHGYLVVANGASGSEKSAASMTKTSDLTASVDWVTKGGAAKYGNIDTDKIAAAGQSCGGVEAMSASYHDPRIKLTLPFNSGVLGREKLYLMNELKAPLGYFFGGPKDIAFSVANTQVRTLSRPILS